MGQNEMLKKVTIPFRGPFTTVCPSCNTHWGGKKTCTVYDLDSMQKVCSVASIPSRGREEATRLAESIAIILNKETGHVDTNH